MIKTIKKYSDIFIISCISLMLGIALYHFINQKIEILAATIVTGISLAIGLRSYKIENDKLFKELFTNFNEAYDKRYNDELIKIDTESHINSEYKLNDKQKTLIVDYLNFSAEEYLWYKMERIPDVVWTSWENGMVYYLNIKCINDFIVTEKKQSDSYYGLFEKIGRRVNNW